MFELRWLNLLQRHRAAGIFEVLSDEHGKFQSDSEVSSDQDGDGKLSFEEFKASVCSTEPSMVSLKMRLQTIWAPC